MHRRKFLVRSGGAVLGTSLGAFGWRGRTTPAAESGGKRKRRPTAAGPLRVHPDNPRYFTDGAGKAVYLTGAHTWNNLVDVGPGDPPRAFDYPAYLDFLQRLDHNFIRLWTWEPFTWSVKWGGRHETFAVAPQPYARTGPGKALDGKPKFDLEKHNADYFDRLRSRVIAAGERGIYVSVMLFEGWAMQFSPGVWESHPFNPANNVNDIDGDKNGDGMGLEVHTLANRAVTAVQEAYLRKLVDTVGDLDNVLYEVSNENHPPSTEWQYHVIDYVHAYEKKKPKQHPVGMTFQYKAGSNRTLFDGPADWISPNPDGGYRDNPPAADGSKVIVSDTDHLWGIGGNRAWVWKSFLRGLNPIFMDPYNGLVLGKRFDPKWEPVRKSMGYARRLADRVNLAAMTPQNKLASTGYCLAHAAAGGEYLVYLPEGGEVTVDLSATPGKIDVQWLNTTDGELKPAGTARGGKSVKLSAPFRGDAVLLLETASEG